MDLALSEADDLEIWRVAGSENMTIMSKDGDFADLALLYGAPPKVVRLRIGNGPWRAAADIVIEHADEVRAFLNDAESSLLILSSR